MDEILGTHSHSRSIPARHLLYRGLRSAPADAKSPLVNEAMTWLGQHGTLPEASFVLKALLDRDLDDRTAAAAGHAMIWLGQHGTLPEARYVLKALLDRDLDDRTAAAAVGHAMTWLGQHGTLPEAEFVLKALLDRDLDDRTAAAAVDHAMTWLGQHGTLPEAQYVLQALLKRDDLGEFRQSVIDKAVSWTEVNGVGGDFVSKTVVRLKILTEPIASSLVKWAADHPGDPDVGWRLGKVVRALGHWGHLTDGLLRAIERTIWTLPTEPTSLNDHSQFDDVLDKLCKSIRNGIPAARLDDLLRIWMIRSEAFGPPAPETDYLHLVSRVCSLLLIKEAAPPHPDILLDRLETWVHQWDCPVFQKAQCLEDIGNYRRLIKI